MMAEPTRKFSNRAQMVRAFLQALGEVRNGRYRVHRGPVAWVGFNFEEHAYAGTVILAQTPLRDSGDASLVLELFTKWREQPVEKTGPLDDLTLDDLHEDVRLVVKRAGAGRRQDGEATIAGVKEAQGVVEEVYVQGVVMGVVATMPVRF